MTSDCITHRETQSIRGGNSFRHSISHLSPWRICRMEGNQVDGRRERGRNNERVCLRELRRIGSPQDSLNSRLTRLLARAAVVSDGQGAPFSS